MPETRAQEAVKLDPAQAAKLDQMVSSYLESVTSLDTHDPAFRERFVQAGERRETELRAAFADAGVDTLELATDDDLVDAVLRFSQMRKQRSRMSTGGALPLHLAPSASRSPTGARP